MPGSVLSFVESGAGPEADEGRTEVLLDRRPSTQRGAVAPHGGASALLGAEDAARVFDSVRRIAIQHDLPRAEYILRRSIVELTRSERVYCLFHQATTGTLWAFDEGTPAPRGGGSEGLASFAARTGSAISAACAARSPLYRPELDDPQGDGSERMIVQPVISAGVVHAVVVAVRSGGAPAYSPIERTLVAAFAEQCAPILIHFLIGRLRRREPAAAAPDPLFRPEALELQAAGRQGDILRLSPALTRTCYRLLMSAVAVALLFACLVSVHRYSSGPALVRLEGNEVTATGPGIVSAVRVPSGARVHRGDVLVELHAAEETADAEHLQAQYESHLAAFLLDPSDRQARSALASTSASLERARARLDERRVRAPSDGIVSDVRVRAGMRLEPGDHLLTVEDESATPSVIALLPGRDRQKLAKGATLKLRLPGHDRTEVSAKVEEVGGEIIGPREARRFLGQEIADTVRVPGPVVVVRARLPARTFGSGDEEYTFHDGMLATGEVEIGSRRLVLALLPGLDEGP